MDNHLYQQRRRSRSLEDFLKEVPPPMHSQRDHVRARKQAYGRNPPRTWEGEQREDYEEYKRHQLSKTLCKAEYKEQENEARSEFETFVHGDEKKQEYYVQTTGGLLPRQHRELAPAASRWDEAEYK